MRPIHFYLYNHQQMSD